MSDSNRGVENFGCGIEAQPECVGGNITGEADLGGLPIRVLEIITVNGFFTGRVSTWKYFVRKTRK